MSIRLGRNEAVMLRALLAQLAKTEDGVTTPLEVDEGDLKLGGVSTEYVYEHADRGFTVLVSRQDLARRILDELDH